MLCESPDLLNWGQPRQLPFNFVFRNQAPALHVDDRGMLWLAWFSNRLHLEDPYAHTGYRLWLTDSPDGRNWSRPKPIFVGAVENWPPEAAHIVPGPKGQTWVFWRDLAGSGKRLEDIRQLDRIEGLCPQARNPHVSFDAAGRAHMVFDWQTRGIHYCTSSDCLNWSKPVEIVPKPRGKAAWRPQLIHHDGKTCLIYEHSDGAFLQGFTAGHPPQLGPPLQITHAPCPLSGIRLCRTPDGQAVLLAGADTAWLLRAKLNDLAGIGGEKQPAPGEPPSRPSVGIEP